MTGFRRRRTIGHGKASLSDSPPLRPALPWLAQSYATFHRVGTTLDAVSWRPDRPVGTPWNAVIVNILRVITYRPSLRRYVRDDRKISRTRLIAQIPCRQGIYPHPQLTADNLHGLPYLQKKPYLVIPARAGRPVPTPTDFFLSTSSR